MSTFNERVSPETLEKIIEAADEVITALAGTNEDIHKDDSTKMCQLWDDLNDRHATPAIVKAMAAEIKQYRAAAEPVTVVLSSRAGNDTSTIDKALPEGFKLYAAPQVTSVPDMAAVGEMPFLGTNEKAFVSGWNACRAAMLTAAPAVQAEQHKRQVIPDGYALVPVEPTAAMQTAGGIAVKIDTPAINKLWTANKVYEAMLAAAPQQEAE